MTAFLCRILGVAGLLILLAPDFVQHAVPGSYSDGAEHVYAAVPPALPKRRSRRSLPKPTLKDMSRDTRLSEGVTYRRMISGNGKYSVHILQIALNEPEHRLVLLKGRDRFNGLERLVDMVARRDSIQADSVLGAVNANFWSANINTAIGPTVSDGVPIHINHYKQWSSAFIDERQQLYIDRFTLQAAVRFPGGERLSIANVNRRSDSLGLILYNAFAGETVPYVFPVNEESVYRELEANAPADGFDSTEAPLRLEEIRAAMMEERRRETLEYRLPKLVLRYCSAPRINRDIPCVVVGIAAGSVAVPYEGALLSLGEDFVPTHMPQAGDTLVLRFSTNVHDTVAFVHSVSGTPRLVRSGRARHEASAEGATSRRFIRSALSRTAIGSNKTRDTLYLVSVDATNRKQGTRGIDLAGLAGLMKRIGCYDAMNLDGGSSATMAVRGQNVVRMGGREFNRRISTALAVVREQDPHAYLWHGTKPDGIIRSFRRSLMPQWYMLHKSYSY